MSVKKPVRYRPYLVKEEKIFLIAKESKDEKDIENAVIQVIKNCTFGELDVDALPSFDLEYLFLKLRSQSVSSVADLQYECRNTVENSQYEDKRCHNRVDVQVPLEQIEITVSDEHSPLVTLNTGLVLEMSYPSLKTARKHSVEGEMASLSALLADCIKTITDADGNVYEMRDYSDKERLEFVESIGLYDLKKFEQFFTTMPTLKHVIPFKCNRCGYEEMMTLQGLAAFF
jgi:hypothetical protein